MFDFSFKKVTLTVRQGWFVKGRHVLFATSAENVQVSRNADGKIIALSGHDCHSKFFAYGTSDQEKGLEYEIK